MSACAHCDDAASYVLGAMPDDECFAFVSHLAGCAICQEAVKEFQLVADALPAAAVQREAPPDIKHAIMRTVRSEAELLRAAGPSADRPPRAAAAPRRRGWLLSLRPMPALALASALVAVGLGTDRLLSSGPQSPATHTIVAKVDPALAPSGRASLREAADGAKLVVAGLPAPPQGRIYQVWLAKGNQPPQPTTVLFSPNQQGRASVDVPGNLKGVAAVLVTDEPLGGSAKPTGSQIISVRPV